MRQPDDLVWQGYNPDKGVGVFAYGDLQLTLDERYDPSIHHCLPVCVRGAYELNLLAIWAMGHKEKARSYIGQVYYAVQRYAEFTRERPTVVVGDFNSNAIWDRERAVSNHSGVVKALAAANIASAYHEYFDETPGQERQHTYYHHRSAHSGWHLDYCFFPTAWLPRLHAVKRPSASNRRHSARASSSTTRPYRSRRARTRRGPVPTSSGGALMRRSMTPTSDPSTRGRASGPVRRAAPAPSPPSSGRRPAVRAREPLPGRAS